MEKKVSGHFKHSIGATPPVCRAAPSQLLFFKFEMKIDGISFLDLIVPPRSLAK